MLSFLRFAILASLALSTAGCAGRVGALTIDDSGVESGDDDELTDAGTPSSPHDAGGIDAAARDGASNDASVSADAPRSSDAGPSSCGTVTPATNHPAFAAIRKLATTTDEVRVLVYGQSISEQEWWSQTKAWLEATYPRGKLVMEQHAHGGCDSRCLIGHIPWRDEKQYNRLPEDVFAWRPDLIIFHVYGDDSDYRYIMRAFREGCAAFDDYKAFDGSDVPTVKCTDAQRAMSAGYRAAEVLVQGDFPNNMEMLKPCPTTYAPGDNWACHMNERMIPGQVQQYGYGLQDNFHDWPKYIAENDIPLNTLVADDNTHLRKPGGTDLMFEMTIPHLCYAP